MVATNYIKINSIYFNICFWNLFVFGGWKMKEETHKRIVETNQFFLIVIKIILFIASIIGLSFLIVWVNYWFALLFIPYIWIMIYIINGILDF